MVRVGTPMYARMIHDLDGTTRPIQYGKKDQVGLTLKAPPMICSRHLKNFAAFSKITNKA